MQRLTQEQFEKIRKRAEAATSGPWTYVSETEDRYEMPKFISPEFPIMSFGDCTAFYPIEGTPPDDADADFIANAREDIPALLAEVERLQNDVIALEDLKDGTDSVNLAEIERLRSVIADFADHGTRHDTNPTIGGRIKRFDDAAGWVAYIRSMDESVRRRAKEALGE